MKQTDLRIIGILLVLGVTLVVCAYASQLPYREGSTDAVARQAVLQTLGMSSMSLASEDMPLRDLSEGAYSCLGDIPGGYCYRESCDIVGFPGALTAPFEMRLIKGES